jgi:hypothetical protein
MKKFFIYLLLFFIACSETPVNMDEKLFDRGGRFIIFIKENDQVENGAVLMVVDS